MGIGYQDPVRPWATIEEPAAEDYHLDIDAPSAKRPVRPSGDAPAGPIVQATVELWGGGTVAPRVAEAEVQTEAPHRGGDQTTTVLVSDSHLFFN